MSFNIISFLKSAGISRPAAPVADDNPLPVYMAVLAAGSVGAPSSARVQSANSTNATSVKATPGSVLSLSLTNNSTVAFFKFYNKASAPTVGTDTPVVTYAVPANGSLNLNFGGGKPFSLGIAYAITNLVADSDTTAVAANQITGSIEYV